MSGDSIVRIFIIIILFLSCLCASDGFKSIFVDKNLLSPRLLLGFSFFFITK